MSKFAYKRVDGMLWPCHDTELLMVRDWVADLREAYKHIDNFRTAFQAGGSVGIWPNALAEKFETVWTLEPDPHSFRCLMTNMRGDNIIALNAALGYWHEFLDVNREEYPTNVGAQYVDPRLKGDIPVLRLDDFDFSAKKPLDFLCLDIEGWEPLALKGGYDVIETCKPVIMLENKPLKQMSTLDTATDEAPRWLKSRGYKQVGSIHRDLILKHESQL